MKTNEQGFIEELDKNEVFVFGSNLAGLHIGGAAKAAEEKFGAIEGQGWGLQGQSFAIPTLSHNFRKLPLEMVKAYLENFAQVAEIYMDKVFHLTPIGTGIAGFSHEEIKSILPEFSDNVVVDESLKNKNYESTKRKTKRKQI